MLDQTSPIQVRHLVDDRCHNPYLFLGYLIGPEGDSHYLKQQSKFVFKHQFGEATSDLPVSLTKKSVLHDILLFTHSIFSKVKSSLSKSKDPGEVIVGDENLFPFHSRLQLCRLYILQVMEELQGFKSECILQMQRTVLVEVLGLEVVQNFQGFTVLRDIQHHILLIHDHSGEVSIIALDFALSMGYHFYKKNTDDMIRTHAIKKLVQKVYHFKS